MLKDEDDSEALLTIRESLYLRIQRDVEKGWLSEKDAQKLIKYYELAE